MSVGVMIGHSIILSYYITFGFCTPQWRSLLKLIYHIAGDRHHHITWDVSESVTTYCFGKDQTVLI